MSKAGATTIQGLAAEQAALILRHRAAWRDVDQLLNMALLAVSRADWCPPGSPEGTLLSSEDRTKAATSLMARYSRQVKALARQQEAERRRFNRRLKQVREPQT